MLKEALEAKTIEAAEVIIDSANECASYIEEKLDPKLERYKTLTTAHQTTRQKEATTTGIHLTETTRQDIIEIVEEMQSVATQLAEAETDAEAIAALACAQERKQRWKNKLIWILAMHALFIAPVDKALKSDV